MGGACGGQVGWGHSLGQWAPECLVTWTRWLGEALPKPASAMWPGACMCAWQEWEAIITDLMEQSAAADRTSKTLRVVSALCGQGTANRLLRLGRRKSGGSAGNGDSGAGAKGGTKPDTPAGDRGAGDGALRGRALGGSRVRPVEVDGACGASRPDSHPSADWTPLECSLQSVPEGGTSGAATGSGHSAAAGPGLARGRLSPPPSPDAEDGEGTGYGSDHSTAFDGMLCADDDDDGGPAALPSGGVVSAHASGLGGGVCGLPVGAFGGGQGEEGDLGTDADLAMMLVDGHGGSLAERPQVPPELVAAAQRRRGTAR
jgi:hypothetical protein